MLTRKNAKASAVLAILCDMYEESAWNKLNVEPYLNGRESGFAVHDFYQASKKVAFSENRNSDNIVVYYGTSSDFSMQGNTPSEKSYRNAKFFSYDEYHKAAKWIYEFLNAKAD